MSPDDALAIVERRYGGVKPNARGVEGPIRSIGFDIETSVGVPYSLAVYSTGAGVDFSTAIKPGEGLTKLLDVVAAIDAQGHGATLAGAHFMGFDLGVLTYDHLRARGQSWGDLPNKEQIHLDLPQGHFHLRMGKVVFATLKGRHRTIHFLNTAHYFVMSLDRAAESLGLPMRKMKKPALLGLRTYSQKVIGPYNRQDARLVAALLDQIVKWWALWSIRPAISAPQMSGRVFCHRYVTRPWVRVPENIKLVALLAYHGGKNGFYRKAGWIKRAYAYDIRSAYTWAMTQLPDVTQGEWQWSETPEGPWGFCIVSGRMPSALRAPVFYSHDFRPLAAGEPFGPLVVTTMEYTLLRELYPAWRPDDLLSVTWKPDHEGMSDLGRYALEMFDRRRAATTPEESQLFKLLSNSLYGKFIARHPDEDDERVMIAGSLFYPPVAAWITALVRAKITRLEYTEAVVHTSTDGILTTRPLAGGVGEGLGEMKFEHAGPCLILRNKLYLHFDRQGHLIKWALHGFQGRPRDLWTMLRRGKSRYTVGRLSGWRESARDDGLPYAPISREMMLNVPELRSFRKEARNPYRIRPKF